MGRQNAACVEICSASIREKGTTTSPWDGSDSSKMFESRCQAKFNKSSGMGMVPKPDSCSPTGISACAIPVVLPENLSSMSRFRGPLLCASAAAASVLKYAPFTTPIWFSVIPWLL